MSYFSNFWVAQEVMSKLNICWQETQQRQIIRAKVDNVLEDVYCQCKHPVPDTEDSHFHSSYSCGECYYMIIGYIVNIMKKNYKSKLSID